MSTRFLLPCLLLMSAAWSASYAQCDAGRLSTSAPTRYGEVRVCTSDGQPDEVTYRFDAEFGARKALVIVDRDSRITRVSETLTIDFEASPAGWSDVYGVSYTGQLRDVIGQRLATARISDACYTLTPNSLGLDLDAPEAGRIESQEEGDSVDVCLFDGSSDYVGFRLRGEGEAESYAYLITDEAGRIEHVNFRGYYDFQYTDPGVRRVYGIAYDGGLLARTGRRLSDALAEGCFDLTDNFITVNLLSVEGGALSVDGERRVTLEPGDDPVISVTREGKPQTNLVYVVIEQPTSIIRSLNSSGDVDLRCLEEGKYLVIAYAYSGQLLASVGDRLWGDTGRFATSCFESSANAVVVRKRSPADCSAVDVCNAAAGQLAARTTELEISGGSVSLEAEVSEPSVLPKGYEQVYLLTQGPDALVVAISASEPSFSVGAAGTYSIRAFVAELSDAESPNYIDPRTITLGQITVPQLDERIAQRKLCADISDDNASFVVTDAAPFVCTAFAGSLQAPTTSVELANGVAQLFATPDGRASVPAGFETRYLLTSGFSFTLEAIGELPSFEVSRAGDFTILTFVGEFTDAASPQYIDLSVVEFGVTTAVDLIAEAFDAGKCVDLDFFGASFQVMASTACTASVGTLTPVAAEVSLSDRGRAIVEAVPGGDAQRPRNFDRTYVLTEEPSGRILGFSARPAFGVNEAGQYAIRTWIGEFSNAASPDYIDLRFVRVGLTTVEEVTAFLDGVGRCSDFDLIGARFEVISFISTRTAAEVDLVASADVAEVTVQLSLKPAAATVSQHARVALIDIRGVVVAQQETTLAGEAVGAVRLSREALPAGLYFVNTVTAAGQRSVPLVLP